MIRPVLTLVLAAWIMGATEAGAGEGTLAFDRNDKVLTWQSMNEGEYSFSDKLRFEAESILSTSLNMTSSESRDRWYDTVTNTAGLAYDYSDRLSFQFSADEDWSRDTMSKFGESLLTTNVDGSVRYQPKQNLSMRARIGQIFDRRFENKDQGTELSAGAEYKGSMGKTMTYGVETGAETSTLNRSVNGANAEGHVTWTGTDIAAVTFGIHDRYDSRGYFSDIDRKEIERRNRHERGMELRVARGDFNSYRTLLPFMFTVNMDWNDITDSANDVVESSKFQNNAHGAMSGFTFRVGHRIWRRAITEWGIEYSRDDNGVQRLTRRRDQTDIATRGSLSMGLGAADTLIVNGWIKRTRIDTPEDVVNDRDELKLESGLKYVHNFTDNLKTALDFRLLETHYVNIDVSQSSQNKWMKTYLLSPSLDYRPHKSVTISHVVNLYANHIVYDYDSEVLPRSNISRRVSAETWIQYRPTSRTTVRVGGMIEDNEYGSLTPDGYKIPAEEGLKRFGDISVEYRFADWLILQPHYNHSIRRDWTIDGDNTSPLRREIDRTFGLSCNLFQNANGGMIIRMQRVVRETERTGIRTRNYITMTLKYGF